MARKRRTAAQIRATKKLVALNKKRARKNAAGPRKTPLQRLKARRQLKRGHKATARWVRAGMPSQRNVSRSRRSFYVSGPSFSGRSFRKFSDARKYAQQKADETNGTVRIYPTNRSTGGTEYVHPSGKRNPKRGAPKGWVKAKYVRVVRGPRGSKILEVKR